MSDLNENNPLKTMNLPVNEHVYKLECMIEGLIDSVEQTDKEVQILKGDLLMIGYENNQQNHEISSFVQDEITRIGREKQNLQDEDSKDIADVRSIIQRVNELKKILNQETAVIDHRISEIESNVGFKYFFDPTLPSDEVN